MNKIKIVEFLKERNALLAEKKTFTDNIDLRYGELCAELIADNCEYKVGQVIDVGTGKRTKRMAIFQIEPRVFDNIVMISLYGWYLNETNNCAKWEGGGISVTGISNPTPVKISDDQTYIEPAA